MKAQKRYALSLEDSERSIVLHAINDFRSTLLQKEKPTEDVDALLRKIACKKTVFSLNGFEQGLLTNAIHTHRTNLNQNGNPTETIDVILRRVIQMHDLKLRGGAR